ncbi:MAG TPA: cyclic pyranopterin monophosphate synthase MoaC [Nevskiaceae bacterium]|nr:cyclic pyranopterin monophosphate synthase MoaC [Nevskiaceae bacterium]
MKDVLDKPVTRRRAVAQAWLSLPAEVMQRLRERRVDKGDALEIARAAAFLAAKRTPELLPLCHPLLIEHSAVHYEFEPARLRIEVTVETSARTGVEMEALTAAGIAALTLYDLLKPHAGTALRIDGLELMEKTGGKQDFRRLPA